MKESIRVAPRLWAPFGLALACMSAACGGDDAGPAADAAPDRSDADPAEQPVDSVERSFDLGPGERVEARIAAGPGDRIHTRMGAPSHPNKSPFVGGFILTDQERADLLAFLRALTDEGFLTDESLSDPFAPARRR